MMAKNIPRRQAIPVLYTRGSHYEVGFDMFYLFQTFVRNLIKFIHLCICLFKNAYNETLESVKQSFPQYIRELEGIADGAQVEFHKVMYKLKQILN
uniref:Uncharacterized protein n=1 Tax=Megaselia scalaris TaxID=36166 RepID=T1GC45_MEGSC